jgi:type IV secretory pathway VirB4 component
MGLNGYFVVSTVWSCTNNANRKSYILQFGSTVSDIDLANSASYSDQRTIQNRNNASSQVIFAGTGGFGTSTTALSTASQNTTSSISLIINGDLANAGDTMTLEAYRVELVYIP